MSYKSRALSACLLLAACGSQHETPAQAADNRFAAVAPEDDLTAAILRDFREESCLDPNTRAAVTAFPVNARQQQVNAAITAMNPSLQQFFNIDLLRICNGSVYPANYAVNTETGAVNVFYADNGPMTAAGDLFTTLTLMSGDKANFVADLSYRVEDTIRAARLQIAYHGWQMAQAAYAMHAAGSPALLDALRDPALNEESETLLRITAIIVRETDASQGKIGHDNAAFVQMMQILSTKYPDSFMGDDAVLLQNYATIAGNTQIGPFNYHAMPASALAENLQAGFNSAEITQLSSLPIQVNDPELSAALRALKADKGRAAPAPAPVTRGNNLIRT